MTTEPADRTSVHEQAVDGFGTLSIRPLDPEHDADLIHSWVTEERARFWGMTERTRDEVRDIYRHMDTLTTHHAWLVESDGTPLMLFQSYDPEADRVSECYDVRPGDIGLHILVGPTHGSPRPGYTNALLSVVTGYLLREPRNQRVVAEPDLRNAKAVKRLERVGFTLGPEILLPEVDLPEVFIPQKAARLAFLDRAALEAFI
ncbi:GNAT family N-acetyltransferase [Streptomyces sp. SCSIO 30461]|uniref:GNAT family N-acetyltransferase n=1 Tax=Streptomyces sp. SCSIO 30461 TaxID=3118085 RepID=UPI0030CDB9FD